MPPPIFRRPMPTPPDPFVDAIGRRSARFNPQVMVVHEFGFGQSGGAQQVLAANPYRIEAWLFAPLVNTGTIFVGAANMIIQAGVIAGASGTNGMDLEPGTGWIIDDTTDALFALVETGKGDQLLKFYEAVDLLAQQGGRAT
jgi:hypothetical protein